MKREAAQFALNHYDFFSIDLDEELSAFNGGLLGDQANFVGDCIDAILKLYEESMPNNPNRPKSVVLLGHSMGGVVARSVFQAKTYRPGTVRTILTLNSPHISAPILFHRNVHQFYSKVNEHWRLHCDSDVELQQTVLVSIAGGLRDTQVHASLSNLDSIIPCKNHISAISTSMPDVWLSLDHTACTWCNQLVSVIAAALAGLIDPQTRQVQESLDARFANLRHYFESTVPAVLQLDSPTPTPTPASLTVDQLLLQHPLSNISAHASSSYKSSDVAKDKDSTHQQGSSHHKQQQQVISWVSSLPVETKKTLVRVSGLAKLSNFQVKWDLFNFPELSHLQMLTTAPLDDLSVLLCDETGLTCLDLIKTSAPMPYAIRENGQGFQTLKAHVIVTSLKDYTISGGEGAYRWLVISSVHQDSGPSESVYKSNFGAEIFLTAQLTNPVEMLTLVGDWTETAYKLGSNLVSHVTLLDANKYLLYHARVVQHECATHPLFTPLILEYSPAMREERYEQKAIALRYHEQFLSYNYKRTTQESIRDSRRRVPMVSQDALHIFVFSDPICQFSLHIRPDWPATVDVMLRNYGVLIIGGIFALSALMVALQLRHAETNPTKPFKQVFSVLAYMLTSFWGFAVVTVYCIPVRFSDVIESLSLPLLQSHSFSMMAKPWPSELAAFLLLVTSLVALTGVATAAAILFLLTHRVPGWIRRGYDYVVSNGGSMTPPIPLVVTGNGFPSSDSMSNLSIPTPIPSSASLQSMINGMNAPTSSPSSQSSGQPSLSLSTSSLSSSSSSSSSSSASTAAVSSNASSSTPPTSNAVHNDNGHHRSPSLDLASASPNPLWSISNPKSLIASLVILSLISVFLHSCLTVIIALLFLALPYRRSDFHITNTQHESMFHFRHAIFVLYLPSLILLAPDMIVWLKNAHFEYGIVDSYERFAIIVALHVLLIKFTSPVVTLQRTSRVHWVLLLLVAYILLFALFPVYRAIDALFVISLAFCLDHIYKVFSTSQERLLKAH